MSILEVSVLKTSVLKASVLVFLVSNTFYINKSHASRINSVYGHGPRKEICDSNIPGIGALANSTIALFEKKDLKKLNNDEYEIDSPTLGEEYDLCSDEPFVGQNSAAICSGILIEPNKILTAGHCVKDEKLSRLAVVFGYSFLSPDVEPKKIIAKNIYTPKKIHYIKTRSQIDYAVVELSETVDSDHPPVELEEIPDPEANDELFMLGHPSGLPLKVVDHGRILEQNFARVLAQIDSFGGNSGSPVFNSRTQKMIGILIEGAKDFTYDRADKCYRSYKCDYFLCKGETITKISAILKDLNKYLNKDVNDVTKH